MITENLAVIRSRIDAACRRAGRDPREVVLIAVSKTKPADAVREAVGAGMKDFGENKAQEMTAKKEEVGGSLNWHFIGNLQRNKVKYVVGSACLIHSVNSAELAAEIERIAAKKELIVPVLVEVNIAGEATKHGLDRASAEDLVRTIAGMKHLKLQGLMAVAPPAENPEDNRGYFREMRILREELAGLNLPGVEMKELSMGMSGDFEVAIEEGATFVRVGSAIFGERDYSV